MFINVTAKARTFEIAIWVRTGIIEIVYNDHINRQSFSPEHQQWTNANKFD
jgi:hypothetical protein